MKRNWLFVSVAVMAVLGIILTFIGRNTQADFQSNAIDPINTVADQPSIIDDFHNEQITEATTVSAQQPAENHNQELEEDSDSSPTISVEESTEADSTDNQDEQDQPIIDDNDPDPIIIKRPSYGKIELTLILCSVHQQSPKLLSG